MKPGSGGETGERGNDPGEPRQQRSLSALGRRWGLARLPCVSLALTLLCLAGCASDRAHVDRSLMADRSTTTRNEGVAEHYAVGCPDVLEVSVPDRPELSGRHTVGPDGRIGLEALGRPRVEGHTPPEIARLVADALGVPEGQVRVRVADYQSQEVYLFGQVSGLQRAVPYQGQETVLDLLQRIGGITPGAAPEDVYVIRTRVAEGQRPEFIHVDLHGIVLNHDQHTNLRVQPFDQIHVGETRQARVERCIPPWLRPLYRALWDTRAQESGIRGQESEVKSQRYDP
jgi:protein involved in polysaccharide export with SLBB domain